MKRIIYGLIVGSFLAVTAVMLRIIYTGYITYAYLIWNLFLAWVPLILSLIMSHISKKSAGKLYVLAILSVVWLLFYPNAAYVVTDIIHLKARPYVPYWIDAYIVISFALLGLFSALASLSIVHKIVKSYMNTYQAWTFVVCVIVLNSIGIYMGRFLRWNTWDIVTNPMGILYETGVNFLQPLSYVHPFLFTVIISCFFLVMYTLFYKITIEPEYVRRSR